MIFHTMFRHKTPKACNIPPKVIKSEEPSKKSETEHKLFQKKKLWNGSEIDFADCFMPTAGLRFCIEGDVDNGSMKDWCSQFRGEYLEWIKAGFNVYSTVRKRYVDDIWDSDSWSPNGNSLDTYFICLKKDILDEKTDGFVQHVECEEDKDIYKLSTPTFHEMNRAVAKHIANCVSWLLYNKNYLLPLSKDEVAMFCKYDSHEKPWERDKVEKFRKWHEPFFTNPKVFDRVFWFEQYDEWKKTGEEKIRKYEELCRQQEKADVHGYLAWQNWKIFQRKSPDDEPTDEGARAYHNYRKEVWALQNEEACFKGILRSLAKSMTDEERQLAIMVYCRRKDL